MVGSTSNSYQGLGETTQNKIKNSAVDSGTPDGTKEPEPERLGVEIGVDTNLAFTTPFSPVGAGIQKTDAERLHEVWRNQDEESGPTVRQLVAMRRMDGQARAIYRLLTLPIRAALNGATYIPAVGDNGEAEFIENVFTIPPESGGMSTTLHKIMGQMLLGLFDGFSAFEKVFWKPTFGPMQGKITLKKLAYRPSETISFIQDESGGYGGIRQRAANGGKYTDIYIEPEYSLYYAAQEEERKFYGVSFFQSAFYHYDKKVRLYYTAHLAAQRAAVGTRVGYYPPNAGKTQKSEFAQQMANLSLAQWMMMPEGYKVEILKEGGSYDFLKMIEHHDDQMAKSLLATFLEKNPSSRGALAPPPTSLVQFADPGDEMFQLMLRAIQDDIADTINRYLIPQLVDFNFSGGHYPSFKWGKLTDEQKKAMAVTFDKVLSSTLSANVSTEFVRALEEQQADDYGLEIDYEAVAEREALAQQQATAQQGGGAPPVDPNAPLSDSTPPNTDGTPTADDQISQFEQQAVKLSSGEDSAEAYRELMTLAGELLASSED